MNIQLDYNITTDEFLEMVNSVGWKTYCREQIELTPTAGNEHFYQKAGFKYNPDKITGMYLWIKK